MEGINTYFCETTTFVKMNIGKNISNIKVPKFNIRINHYLLSTIIIGLTALVYIPLQKMQGYHVVSYIFLFIVSILATFVGIGPVFFRQL